MNRPCSLAATIVVLHTLVAMADNWPTHLHDNQRSGKSAESLPLPLKLQWSKKVAIPQPAWPNPAKQDYWHHKTNLRPRVIHDRANGIVVADGRLIVSSSSDDQVRAFDATTGEQLWTTFAEGPIRLAPTIWEELVVFASDDGFAYGVNATSGELKWKTRGKEVGTRRIPGNGRLISERPIRSGVLIDSAGTGYFVAGIFPQQGAYFYSIDVRNGEILDRARIHKSVQGYLESRNDRVFAPTGRDPSGTTLGGSNSDQFDSGRKQLPEAVYSIVEDQTTEFHGKAGKVTALQGGNEIWSAILDGRPYSMAISDGQLFVSTDSGWVYCFGANDGAATASLATKSQEQAKPRLDGTQPGYVLIIDPPDTKFDAILSYAKNSRKQVVLAMRQNERVSAFRKRLAAANVYGRVVVHTFKVGVQPNYAKNIFHWVSGTADKQLHESVSPYAGTAELSDLDIVFINPNPQTSGDWTHAYGTSGNIASSNARIGGDKLKLQWFGGPGPRKMVDRHMRTMPPLVCRGQMYIPGLDRVITVDAFTGVVQWEEEIPDSTRIGMLKDCGWMVAVENKLYVAVNEELLRLQTTTNGHTKIVTNKVPFHGRDWGYLACVNDRIIGSSTLKNAARRTINRDAILEGAYTDNRPIVCSDALFAFDETSPKSETVWRYESSGAILNPSIAATSASVFFVENEMGDLETTTSGRVRLSEFWKSKPKLVAIDLLSGKQRWSKSLPVVENPQNAFVLSEKDHVILVNSRNAQTVHYDVRVFSADDGTELWSATQDNLKQPGGDHGEQDKHPVLIGSKLIVEPFAYDLSTGAKLTELNLSKRGYGCGTLSGSADALFFRSGNPARYSLKTNEIELVTAVSRPSCWINMIPAEGLLLIPEGSSGCTCNSYPVQTSMAFTTE